MKRRLARLIALGFASTAFACGDGLTPEPTAPTEPPQAPTTPVAPDPTVHRTVGIYIENANGSNAARIAAGGYPVGSPDG